MSADLAAPEDNTTRIKASESGSPNVSNSQNGAVAQPIENGQTASREPEGAEEESDSGDGDDDDDEDEEEKLKYAKLTGNLSAVYRNGDSTSSQIVAGDKVVVGTHNGNVHVLSLPDFAPIRTYHAHQASVTSVSISPVPPPPTSIRSEEPGSGKRLVSLLTPSISTPLRKTQTSGHGTQKGNRPQNQTTVPNTPNNQIYVATSSLDGHVCVSSLVDPNDVLLRNFARPVQAVTLSPDYKNDRTYLSGGLAGSLILTVGGRPGVSSDANTNSAAAAASGWLGSIGLGTANGKDTILHSGEGSISTVKWSLSGKWVVWANEEGFKIMRSHYRLGSEQSEYAWRRIAHVAKPNRKVWQDMAGVWKARAEWIDEDRLEVDSEQGHDPNIASDEGTSTILNSKAGKQKRPEKLVVGWGDIAWVLHIREGSVAADGRRASEKQIGSAEIMHKLQFQDCIVSGVTMYTPTLLAILAYRTRDDDDKPIKPPTDHKDAPRKGRSHRKTGLRPQLRLVRVADGEEVELDELPMSRFETLSAQDYHLGSMYMPRPLLEKEVKEQKGALELMWEVSGGSYAQRMFSSSASVLGRTEASKDDKSSVTSPSSVQGIAPPSIVRRSVDAHPYASNPGLKLFVQSPYDCALAVKREIGDRLNWLLERQSYAEAWQLVHKHPEVVDRSTGDGTQTGSTSQPTSPSHKAGGAGGSLVDFFADDGLSSGTRAPQDSVADKEKERIGDLWIQQLISKEEWYQAGRVAGQVLGQSHRWEHWILEFVRAGKFDEITSYIPSSPTSPPVTTRAYDAVLEHYLSEDPARLKELLDRWAPELYDAGALISAIETTLDSSENRRRSSGDGSHRRHWQLLVNTLAQLYLIDQRPRDALRCYIRAQNAEAALSLIKEENLVDAVTDDIVGLLTLKVSKDMLKSSSIEELEEASSEAMQILVGETRQGSITPATVIRQLQNSGTRYRALIFLYLRALWQPTKKGGVRKTVQDDDVGTGRALVEDNPDLAVTLFAEYDRDLFMAFLRASSLYDYDKAAAICEQRRLTPALVYILGKMGQTKKALFLIIDDLGDVSQAIAFTKENPDLWNDLLDYSMDKPRFIRGLLEEVGTSINPIDLVRRIPEGLEIEGLRNGIQKMIRDYEIQHSISEGVARVMRGEVVTGLNTLRAGQKKAVKFEVLIESANDVDLAVKDPPTTLENGEVITETRSERIAAKPGHCVGCHEPFSEHEHETLIGFACGHVYHLSCLLRANPNTKEEEIQQLQVQLGRQNGSQSGRSVGAKVAHAHIIRNMVQGGCRYCDDHNAQL